MSPKRSRGTTRQTGREHAGNVVDASAIACLDALRRQVKHGAYPSSPLYGDGTAAPQILDALED